LFLSSKNQIFWIWKKTYLKPVEHTDDFRLKATIDKSAPITLVRLILAGGPLFEKQITSVIFKLALFSGSLAIITALMMRIFI